MEFRVVVGWRLARADEHEGAWDLLLIVGEVLTGQVDGSRLHGQARRLGHLDGKIRPGGRVIRRWRSGIPGQLSMTAEGSRLPLCEFVDALLDALAVLRRQAANRPLEPRGFGDDVPGVAALDVRDRDEARMCRVDVARDDALRRRDEARRHDDRVRAALWMCRMRALAAERHRELVDRSRHSARADAERADIVDRRGVQAEDGLHILEHTCLHDLARTARRFLRRLEDQVNRAMEILFLRLEQVGRAEHCADVEVMAAGVHTARVLRGVVEARLLLDWQAVDVTAQRDERRLPCADLGYKACLERQVEHLNARRREVSPQALRRLDFLIRKFRMAVEPVEFIRDLLEDFLFIHIDPSLYMHSSLVCFTDIVI